MYPNLEGGGDSVWCNSSHNLCPRSGIFRLIFKDHDVIFAPNMRKFSLLLYKSEAQISAESVVS